MISHFSYSANWHSNTRKLLRTLFPVVVFLLLSAAGWSNEAPVLDPVGDKSVCQQSLLAFTATATDADLPDQLTFSLEGETYGAAIDALSGEFSWIPAEYYSGPYQFTVRVTDNGDPVLYDEEIITVTVNPIPSTPVVSSNSPVCEGSDLIFTVEEIPGATYFWEGPNSYTSTDQNPVVSAVTSVSAGTYSVTATVDGCASAAGTVEVTVNPIPSTPVVSSNSPVCEGSDLIFTVEEIPGATYFWEGPNGYTSTDQNPVVSSVTSVSAGTYSVTATVDGCASAAGTVEVTVNPIPSTPVVSSNSPVCEGSDLIFTVEEIPGATYFWTGPNSYTSTDQNPVVSSVTSVSAGTFSVTATVDDCASAEGTVEVTVNPIPSTPVVSSNSPVCEGSDLIFTVEEIPGATYFWTGPNGYTSTDQNPVVSSVTSVSAGTYSVTATVDGCASAAGTVEVTVNPIPSTPVVSSNSPVCEGSDLIFTVEEIPGATYFWEGPNSYTSTDQNPVVSAITSVSAGTYSVTATVDGCASAAGTVEVTVNPIPSTSVVSSNSPVCEGSDLIFTVEEIPGATYFWEGPNSYTSTDQNPVVSAITSVSAGTYSVTATVDGCASAAGTVEVTVNPIPSTPVVSSNSPVCEGSDLILTVEEISGATYSWTGPNGFTSNDQNPVVSAVTSVSAGTYSVTATVDGCTSAAGTVEVTVNPIPSTPVVSSNSPVCEGSDLILTVEEISGATYSWTGPNGFTSNDQNPVVSAVTSVSAGTYSVTATVDGCTSAAGTVEVTVNPIPSTPVVSSNSPVCEGSDLIFTVEEIPGATYFWTGPNGYTSTDQNPVVSAITSVSAGTYSVTATVDACASAEGTVEVTVNPLPTIAISSAATCAPDLQTYSLEVTVSEGTVTSTVGKVTDLGANVWSITKVPDGTNITVTVEDGNGCTNSVSVTAPDCSCPVIEAPVSGGDKNYCENGTIPELTVTVGEGETADWYDSETGGTLLESGSLSYTPLVAGDYYAEARQIVSGCISSKRTLVRLTMDPLPGPAETISGSATVCQDNTFTYFIEPVSNANGYSWSYSGSGVTLSGGTANYTEVSFSRDAVSGTLTVYAYNACGQGSESSLDITVNPLPGDPLFIIGPGHLCPNSSELYFVEGITDASSYEWEYDGTGVFMSHDTVNDPPNSIKLEFHHDATSGILRVSGVNECGISSLISIYITVYPLNEPVISGPSSVCEGSEGNLYTTEPGMNFYSWWTSSGGIITEGEGTNSITVTWTTPGEKAVGVTYVDENGCESFGPAIYDVTVNALPTITISSAATCAPDLQTYSLEVTVSEGTVTSTAGTVTDLGANVWSITEVPAGMNITVTVEDGNGCTNSVSVTAPDCSCPVIEAPVSGGDKNYCENGTIPELTVTVGAGETADWYDSEETGGTLLESGTLSYTPLVAGDYYAEARQIASGCISSTRTRVRLTMDPLPGPAGTIDGPATVCQGVSDIVYDVPEIEHATSYEWTLPAGVTGNSSTNSITVSFGTTGVSGNITVKGVNGCGNGSESSLAVTVNPLPGAAGTIDGSSAVCQGESEVYTVPEIEHATSYEWTLPAGAIGTGSSNSITVSYGLTSVSGDITVKGLNSCGEGIESSLSVVVNPLPSPISGKTYLGAGESTTLTSTPAGGTWTSSNTTVATVNLSTGILTGVSQGTTLVTYTLPSGCAVSETFNVLPGDWTADPQDYIYNGRVIAGVTIEGTPVQSGFLAAFVDDECRGIAQPVYYGPSDHYIFNLTCYSDNTEGDVLVFKYYDPAGNKLYNLDRSVDFVPGMTAGTETDPLLMNVGVDYSVSFPVGWKWFSVNTTLDNMSLEFILSSVNTSGDYIKNQVESANYIPGVGWFGTLKEIRPTELYKIKVQNSNMSKFTGKAVDLDTTTIELSSGWNWIGYMPQEVSPINDALSSLSLVDLDYIKSQSNSASYITGFGWFGNLDFLDPSEGYMLRLTNPGILRYPVPDKKGAYDLADKGEYPDSLKFNFRQYEFNGTVWAQVFLDDVPAGSDIDTLYAYVGDEIRGTASGLYLSVTDKWLYNIMVYSDLAQGEVMNFGFYDSVNDKYLECDETVEFIPNMIIGEPLDPFEINAHSNQVNVENIYLNESFMHIYPNPFENNLNIEYELEKPANVRLTVHDIYNRMINVLTDQHQEAGNYLIRWDSNLPPSGIYYIRLQIDTKTAIKKVILMQ